MSTGLPAAVPERRPKGDAMVVPADARCWRWPLLFVLMAAGCAVTPPEPDPDPGPSPQTDPVIEDGSVATPSPPVERWAATFAADATGALSAVWGTGPDDIFVVGGTPARGEIYHFDGSVWREQVVPDVPLLVWVTGFTPHDAWAVGVGGGVVSYDGTDWTALDSGTTADLWGVWGAAPDDIWIVGGTVGGPAPVVLHFDGRTFTPWAPPVNDRSATALFKVWGIDGVIHAVGENGLIARFDGSAWNQMAAGSVADDDFVALWGSRRDRIVAVGGRGTARIARFDGSGWSTARFSGVPGLNAIALVNDTTAIVGGANGYVGRYDIPTATLVDEAAPTTMAVHGAWFDGAGTTYGVGGRFSAPYAGVALARSATPASAVSAPVAAQTAPQCAASAACGVGQVCSGGACVPAPGCSGGDRDGDGWLNACDNCPDDANAAQRDKDGDGRGDACDRCRSSDDRLDADGDGVPDGCDRCPDGADHVDTDADGVADACDRCPGAADDVDSDADGVADGCDVCAGADDALDADADGVPDGCDVCDGAADTQDGDGDGVPNGCDVCPGFSDGSDADGDGVPDGCDTCEGANGPDSDADGAPDACDRCPGFDDAADADTDGVPDGCDACPGAPDGLDADGDGVADGCDACPGFNDRADADGDGVADGCDACAAGADAADADGDGVPDACDVCPGAHDGEDGDGDGVADGCDLCPGFDDGVDADGNGVPDGCCAVESDCPLGSNCLGSPGACGAATGPDLQLGQPGPYRAVAHGGPLAVTLGFQGLIDTVVSYRTTGFDPGAAVSITIDMTWAATGEVLVDSGFQATFFEVEPGINEFTHGLILSTPVGVSAADMLGGTAVFTLSVAGVADPSVSATLTQDVVLTEQTP